MHAKVRLSARVGCWPDWISGAVRAKHSAQDLVSFEVQVPWGWAPQFSVQADGKTLGKISAVQIWGAFLKTAQKALRLSAPPSPISSAQRRFETLIFSHHIGGGAEKYLRSFAQKSHRMVMPVANADELFRELADCEFQEIVLNQIYSWPRPLQTLQSILRLADEKQARLVFLVHDYYCICPTAFLINSKGKYCDIPEPEICKSCLSQHLTDSRHFAFVDDITTWRHTWEEALRRCDEIRCHSESSRQMLLKAYPNLQRQKIEVAAASLNKNPLSVPPHPLHIAVIGHISFHKGSQIVWSLYPELQKRNVQLTVFGSLSGAKDNEFFRVVGPYQNEDLAKLLETFKVNFVLFPSVCPETFSYVCSEVMQLGLPLACFDLGAQGERVGKYEKGLILKDTNPEKILDSIQSYFTISH